MGKIIINKEEIMKRLYGDEVEIAEKIVEGKCEPVFDDDFGELEEWIDNNVKLTYIEEGQFYINDFYLELINGGQAVIKIF